MQPDHWQRVVANCLAAAGDIAGELAGACSGLRWPPSMSPNTSASSRGRGRPSIVGYLMPPRLDGVAKDEVGDWLISEEMISQP
jgi:hypothetical protein